MNPHGQEILEQFHRALVQEIRRVHPEYLRAPFPVSEIYQRLVPYRTHRDRIGAGMSAEYEHALLRLLSGEGGCLELDSDSVREAIRRELDSPNPNTGIYREFAAVQVRLAPGRVIEVGAEDRAPEPSVAMPASPPSAPGTWGVVDVPARSPGAAGELPEHCRNCGAALPRRPTLHFCPFCGENVRVVPCPSCGEELELEWRYCITCGHEVAAP